MKRPFVLEWHKQFKEIHKNVKDNERYGHSRSHRTDKNVDKVWKLIDSDRHLSIRAMAM
jgi:hypothetical protein